MKNINALKMIAVMMVIVASPVIAQEWDGTGPCFCNAGCYNSRTCERGYEVSPSECGVSATAGSVCADGYYCTSPTNYYGICEPCGDDDEEYWINEQDTEGSVAACCFDSSAGCAWIDSGNQIHCNVKDAAGNGGFEGGSGDEGTCVDGIDNDCDGLTDCYDTDCHIGAQCKMSVCTAGQCDEVYGPGTDQCSLHTDCQHYSCVSSVCTLINDDSPDIADDCTYDGECSAVYAWELVAEGTNLITYETGPECVNIPDEDADTCIRITRGNDGTVCGDNNDRVCYAYLTQDVGMLPQGKYELSAWVKGNDAKIGWHYQGQPYAYVSSTQADWKRISITIGADGAREVIIILEPDKQSVGDFFYDDIQLIRVNSGTDIPAFVPKQGAFLAPPGQASFSEDQYYPSGCCADTHCWSGYGCVEGQEAISFSSADQIPFCVKGADNKAAWQMSYYSDDFDGEGGYCADESFCYHDEECYEDGATQGGYLCHQGSWISRTRLLAGYMISLAEQERITDYRLLCDKADFFDDRNNIIKQHDPDADPQSLEYVQYYSHLMTCILYSDDVWIVGGFVDLAYDTTLNEYGPHCSQTMSCEEMPECYFECALGITPGQNPDDNGLHTYFPDEGTGFIEGTLWNIGDASNPQWNGHTIQSAGWNQEKSILLISNRSGIGFVGLSDDMDIVKGRFTNLFQYGDGLSWPPNLMGDQNPISNIVIEPIKFDNFFVDTGDRKIEAMIREDPDMIYEYIHYGGVDAPTLCNKFLQQLVLDIMNDNLPTNWQDIASYVADCSGSNGGYSLFVKLPQDDDYPDLYAAGRVNDPVFHRPWNNITRDFRRLSLCTFREDWGFSTLPEAMLTAKDSAHVLYDNPQFEGCCPITQSGGQCWTGFACVESGESEEFADETYYCRDGSWSKEMDWDWTGQEPFHCQPGYCFCPDPTFNVHGYDFDETHTQCPDWRTGAVPCVPAGWTNYQEDHYCLAKTGEPGIWTTRTALVADVFTKFIDYHEISDYTIHCDELDAALPDYMKADESSGDAHSPELRSKAMGSLCVFRYVDTDGEEKVAFGFPLKDFAPGSTEYNDAYYDALDEVIAGTETSEGIFGSIYIEVCDGKGKTQLQNCERGDSRPVKELWFDAKKKLIFFGSGGIQLVPPDYWGVFTGYISDPFTIIVNWLNRLLNEETPLQPPENFDKYYSVKKPGVAAQAAMRTKEDDETGKAWYGGFTADLNKTIFQYDGDLKSSRLMLNNTWHSFVGIFDPGPGNSYQYWQALTSKLRIQPKTGALPEPPREDEPDALEALCGFRWTTAPCDTGACDDDDNDITDGYCCGDDSQENYICTGELCACCRDPFMDVLPEGCVKRPPPSGSPSIMKDTPISS